MYVITFNIYIKYTIIHTIVWKNLHAKRYDGNNMYIHIDMLYQFDIYLESALNKGFCPK